jgi:hypothetical protein
MSVVELSCGIRLRPVRSCASGLLHQTLDFLHQATPGPGRLLWNSLAYYRKVFMQSGFYESSHEDGWHNRSSNDRW